MSIVYLDDHFLPESEAKVPITDRALLFGDGVFTTMRIAKGKAIWVEEHLAKLAREAARFHLIPPALPPDLFEELIARNEVQEGRLKLLYRGGDSPLLSLPKRQARPLALVAPLHPEPSVIRARPCQLPSFPGKTLSYLPRLWAREQALPYDDCITLNERGEVLQTACGNLFWKVGERYFTPDPALGLYWGVTIEKVCAQHRVTYVRMQLEEIEKEALFFRTNAVSGITPLQVIASAPPCVHS